MPIIIALLVRSVIQFAVTLGIVELADKYLFPLVNSAIAKVIEAFGVSESVAQDIVANSVLGFAEQVGVGVILLRAKLPTRIAERLGFTSKGWNKRPLPKEVAAKVPGSTVIANTTVMATAAEAETIATEVAKTRGITFAQVKSVTTFIATLIGLPVGVFYAFAQYMDYAAWQNPYQKTMEGLLAKIGIHPDTVIPKARTISADTWKRIYSTVEELNPTGISDPVAGMSVTYSREALANLIDNVAAKIAAAGGQASYRNVLATALPLISISGAPAAATIPSTAKGAAGTPIQTPTLKVFTGVVSQGVLGSGTTFTPRPDDLITDLNDLKVATQNNLAPFLAALASKVTYQVQIVPSVTLKNGFTQRGQATKVQVGTHANGIPKYKTVVNKFAVLDLFILNDKGSKTKITRIVLGPTDAIHFQPGGNELNLLENQLMATLTTSDTAHVGAVQTPGGVATVQTPTQPTTPTAPAAPDLTTVKGQMDHYGVSLIRYIDRVYYHEHGDKNFIPGMGLITDPQNVENSLGVQLSTLQIFPDFTQNALFAAGYNGAATSKANMSTDGFKRLLSQYMQNEFGSGTAPVVSQAVIPQITVGSGATTLFEWYQAKAQALPSLADRAIIYEQMGLGPANFYTGTAEQNTKLLLKLQGK